MGTQLPSQAPVIAISPLLQLAVTTNWSYARPEDELVLIYIFSGKDLSKYTDLINLSNTQIFNKFLIKLKKTTGVSYEFFKHQESDSKSIKVKNQSIVRKIVREKFFIDYKLFF